MAEDISRQSSVIRELRTALASFDHAKEWEWSDLIKWLELIKSIIESPEFDFENESQERYLLFKRLAQCLNPNLPPGLHYNTLKIYEILLYKRNKKLNPMDDISMISAGIFPFFEYASPQTKPLVIHLVQEYYLKLGDQLTLCFSGMMSALLTGLEDVSDTEISSKLFKLFDDIENLNKRGLFTAVWQALLKSPRAKVGALTFLMKRMQKLNPLAPTYAEDVQTYIPNKDLVVNALIAGLKDEEVLVKRQTLDVIKSFFPLKCQFISQTAFNSLLKEVLVLLAGKDFTLNRRVWEWLGLHDNMDIYEITETLTPALMEFFDLHQASEIAAFLPIGIIEPLLDQPELTQILLDSFTSQILGYVKRFKYIKDCKDCREGKDCSDKDKHETLGTRWKNLLNTHSDDIGIVWAHLRSKLEDQMNTYDLEETLDAIELMLSLNLDIDSTDFLTPVLENLMVSMEYFSALPRKRAQELVLQILSELSKEARPSITECAKSYEKFLEQEVKRTDLEAAEFSLSMQVYLALQNFESFASQPNWVHLLFTAVQYQNVDLVIVASHFILKLAHGSQTMTDSFSVETNGLFVSQVVTRLWELTTGPSYLKIAETFISYFEEYPEIINGLLKAWLNTSDVQTLSLHLQRFSYLWKVTQKASEHAFEQSSEQGKEQVKDNSKDFLMRFFGGGSGVHDVIRALEHPAPLIRYHGKQWLMQALTRMDVVIQAVLPLSPKPEERSFTRLAIRQLTVLIESGGEQFISKLRKEMVPQQIEDIEKRPEQLKPSYFNTLLFQIVLKVFVKETKEPKDSAASDGDALQSDACVVVKQLISWGDAEAAVEVSPYLLWKLARVVERKGSVLQYQLIEIMQIIIFKSKLKVEQLVKVVGSSDFLKVIGLGLTVKSKSALAFWIRLLPDFLSLAISILDVKDSCQLFQDVMLKLRTIMSTSHDLAIHNAYISLLHLALKVSKPIKFVKDVNSLFAWKYQEISTLNIHPNAALLLMKIVKGQEPDPPPHPTFRLLTAVFEEAKSMLINWPVINEPIREQEGAGSYDPVVRALAPFADDFANELTAVFINAWFTLQEQEDEVVDNQKEKLVQIYLQLKLPGIKILSSFEKFLREGLDLKKSRKLMGNLMDIRLCEFLYSLISNQCIGDVDPLEAWKLLLKINEAFGFSSCPDCPLWAAELMTLASASVPFDSCYGDKKLVKEIQQRIQTLVQAIIALGTSPSGRAIEICPPSAVAVHENSIQVCSLLTLKSSLMKLVNLGWNSEIDQVTQLRALTAPLLSIILDARSTLQDDMTTDIIAELVKDRSPAFAMHIKRDIIDFFTTDEFWNKLRNVKYDYNHWRLLLGLFVRKCFDDRTQIVQEVLKKLNVGFFTSKSSEIQQRAKIFRCLSLLIYSGESDEYKGAVGLLVEKIIEGIKIHEGALIPMIFLLCRVMLIKLDVPTVSEIWPRLWPHLFVELVRIFSDNVAAMHQLSAVKLLELLYLIGNEDFQFSSWVFFHTAPDTRPENETHFSPCVAKLFQANLKHKVEVKEVRDSVPKGLVITSTAVDRLEDFQAPVQEMLASILSDSSTSLKPDLASVYQVIEMDVLNLEVI